MAGYWKFYGEYDKYNKNWKSMTNIGLLAKVMAGAGVGQQQNLPALTAAQKVVADSSWTRSPSGVVCYWNTTPGYETNGNLTDKILTYSIAQVYLDVHKGMPLTVDGMKTVKISYNHEDDLGDKASDIARAGADIIASPVTVLTGKTLYGQGDFNDKNLGGVIQTAAKITGAAALIGGAIATAGALGVFSGAAEGGGAAASVAEGAAEVAPEAFAEGGAAAGEAAAAGTTATTAVSSSSSLLSGALGAAQDAAASIGVSALGNQLQKYLPGGSQSASAPTPQPQQAAGGCATVLIYWFVVLLYFLIQVI